MQARTKILSLVLATGVAIAVGAGILWHAHTTQARLRARLPATPDVSTQPAALRVALRSAEKTALSTRHTLDGVAELGRLYHANGYNQEAATCWRVLHQEQPQEARWCYYLADLHRAASDDAGAASLLDQTLRLAPDYAPALLRLADLEFKTGALDTAERDYKRRLVLLPGDPYARLGLARVALQSDRREEGRRLIEQIVREVPAFATAHNLYAEMLAADGDAESANKQRWLARLAGRFRDADDAWLEELRAWCYDPARLAVWASIDDLTGHGDRGAAFLERAIKLAPNDPRNYDELGRIHLELGHPDKARTQFELGIKLPDAASTLYVNLGQAYRDLHEPDRALQVAEQGLARMPDAAELQNSRGMSLQSLGRLEEAVAAYRLAAERAPTVCEAHFNLGNALLQLGRKDEGFASLKRVLELKPSHPLALAMLGQSELEAGRLDAAAQYLRPLFTYYPETIIARRLMPRWCLQAGIAAAHAGRMTEAESTMREGVTISPDDPDLHGRLGLLYAQERRFAEALDQLETYRRLQPAEPLAALFLGQVYADLNRTDDARRTLTDGARLASSAGQPAIASKCEELLRRLSP